MSNAFERFRSRTAVGTYVPRRCFWKSVILLGPAAIIWGAWEQATVSDFEFVSNVDDLQCENPEPVQVDEVGRHPAPAPSQWTEI